MESLSSIVRARTASGACTPVARKGCCAPWLRANLRLLGRRLFAGMEEDWATEYLAPILSIKVVEDFDAAVDHIARFGSGHTDGIVTQCHSSAMRFLRVVDSSAVRVNASTRFADGFEYGLGAEIGISTDKIHASGPVGLEGLTSQKYVVLGNGHIRV